MNNKCDEIIDEVSFRMTTGNCDMQLDEDSEYDESNVGLVNTEEDEEED